MIEKLPFGSKIKAVLNGNKTYLRWKYSEAGLWLWRKFAQKNDEIIKREELFYRKLLAPIRSKHAPIFDIGANVGWLSKTYLEYSEKVVAVEPDSFCQEILKNRLGHSNSFILIPKAVSSEAGKLDLLVQEAGSALNTFSEKWRNELELGYLKEAYDFTPQKVSIPTITIDQLVTEFGMPSLLKIDIEGHELEAFKGLTQPIPLLVFEANLPVFLEETVQIIEMLMKVDSQADFNYAISLKTSLPDFINSQEMLAKIESLGKCSIDIICRMSNYADYYHPV